MKIWSVGLGLMTGNFIWQAVQAIPDWGIASDRSFFQLLTLVAIWLVNRNEK
jgi:hypothetical protein